MRLLCTLAALLAATALCLPALVVPDSAGRAPSAFAEFQAGNQEPWGCHGWAGTDVAREAAVVVLDDDFSSIVAAVRVGRRIYDNLKKAMGFVLAMHVPIAGIRKGDGIGWRIDIPEHHA